jgi:Xaa-Pro aminopeptidase
MKNEEIEKHKIAAEKLELIKNRAFDFIKRNVGRISEYDVENFILSEFKRENLFTQGPNVGKNPCQIVATNENTAFVHYFPEKKNAKIIKKNSLILIDIWAKLNEERAPFADISWMGYCGKVIPKEIRKAFMRVIGARNFTVNFIKRCLKNREFPGTRDVEMTTRNYFRKFGLEKFFLHRTGHGLGFRNCHGKYFRFDKKSKARIKPNIPFTIEPGLYFKNKFGIRSEINCYVTENYKLIITTKIQKEIVKI